MLLGKVVGNVVSTVKVADHNGFKLLMVRPENLDGTLAEKRSLAA